MQPVDMTLNEKQGSLKARAKIPIRKHSRK
jgi:hypothetical protein